MVTNVDEWIDEVKDLVPGVFDSGVLGVAVVLGSSQSLKKPKLVLILKVKLTVATRAARRRTLAVIAA